MACHKKDVTMVFDEIFNTMLEGLKRRGACGVSGFWIFQREKIAVRHRYVLSTQKVVLYRKLKSYFLGWLSNLNLREME